MNRWHRLPHVWALETWCSVKEARHKTSYCVVLLTWDALNRQIHRDRKQMRKRRGAESGQLLTGTRFISGGSEMFQNWWWWLSYNPQVCQKTNKQTKNKSHSLHTLNGWIVRCVHFASECRALWRLLAGGLNQSCFPSSGKALTPPWGVTFCCGTYQVFQVTAHPDSLRTVHTVHTSEVSKECSIVRVTLFPGTSGKNPAF